MPVPVGADPQALATVFAAQLETYLAEPEFVQDLQAQSPLFENVAIDPTTIETPATTVIQPPGVSRSLIISE